MSTTDVLVIGGGPAGLSAATQLARLGHLVTLVEREADLGGVPRHCHHTGFGITDLRRVLSGPVYARRLQEAALNAGVKAQTGAMVTNWVDEHTVAITSPHGRQHVEARAIVLATGARERPRSARLIPGDRVSGVLTTGQLQQLVHLRKRPVGSTAVVIGAEWVSWSAVLTLREAGVRTALVTTTDTGAGIAGLGRWAVPLATHSRVARIIGRDGRVCAVEVEDLRTGAQRTIACDTVVTTADWIPDHELARSAGLTIDPGTRGPLIDQGQRTSRPGVFAVGNLVHPVATASTAARSGHHVVDAVEHYLQGSAPPGPGVAVLVDPPLRWVSPQTLRAGEAAAAGRLLVWFEEHVGRATVVARQGGRELGRHRLLLPAGPGRAVSIPESVLSRLDPHGPPVTLTVTP